MKYTRTLFIGLLSLTVACHNDINPYLKKNIDWWESSVDYFLLPVTFVNADKSNDSSIKDTLYHLVIPPSIILHRINMQLCMNFQVVLYNNIIFSLLLSLLLLQRYEQRCDVRYVLRYAVRHAVRYDT